MSVEHRYKLWPYTKLEDGSWSIPDTIIHALWLEMLKENRARVVFYNGFIRSPEEWMAWMKADFNHPVLVVDTKEKQVVFVAWLNSVVDRVCFAHFCGIGEHTYRQEIPELVMKYWSSMRNGDGKCYFKAIFAMIPETNDKAIRLATRAGFHFMGSIPELCDLVYEGKTVGGAFGYFIPPKEDEHGRRERESLNTSPEQV